MKKISGIIPSDKRITTVDLRSGGTMRPGMPSFGRTVGPSPMNRPEFQTEQAAMQRLQDQRQANTARDQQAAIVRHMANLFFVHEGETENAAPAPAVVSPIVRESRENLSFPTTESTNSKPVSTTQRFSEAPFSESPNPSVDNSSSSAASTDPRDQLVSGQHLDVRA